MHQLRSLLVIAAVISMLPSMAAANPVVDADRERIQQHLAEVEDELRDRDVSHLSPELQQEREQNLDVLREYRKAGEFPRNTHVPWRQPVFIDRADRACAVGHLMIESGWDEEARRIQERENLAYLPDMESPEVGEWVAQSGLTAEEAALIQPNYSPCMNCSSSGDPVCGDDGTTYINECVAEHCKDVERWHDGCCEKNDDILQRYDDEPEACRDVSGENYDDDDSSSENGEEDEPCELCPTGTDSSQVSDDDWQYPEETDERACASTNPTTGGFWLAMLVLSVMAWRRTSTSRRVTVAE